MILIKLHANILRGLLTESWSIHDSTGKCTIIYLYHIVKNNSKQSRNIHVILIESICQFDNSYTYDLVSLSLLIFKSI